MLGFTPFKKHANKFSYTPRYYDPEKERRAQRRAELRGERHEGVEGDYEPGQYIRTAYTARAARREAERALRSKKRYGLLLVGVVLILLFSMVIYPRITALMESASRQEVSVRSEERRPADAFDQSGISDDEWRETPITIVPNDYQGE